jgi:hypothetical protein
LQDIDGLILVHDVRKSGQEVLLESLYKQFAQQSALKTNQCLMLGCDLSGRKAQQLSHANTRLARLPQATVAIDTSNVTLTEKALQAAVDALVHSCLDRQAQKVEDEVACEMEGCHQVHSLGEP